MMTMTSTGVLQIRKFASTHSQLSPQPRTSIHTYTSKHSHTSMHTSTSDIDDVSQINHKLFSCVYIILSLYYQRKFQNLSRHEILRGYCLGRGLQRELLTTKRLIIFHLNLVILRYLVPLSELYRDSAMLQHGRDLVMNAF